jgi:hypothetical protein
MTTAKVLLKLIGAVGNVGLAIDDIVVAGECVDAGG